MLESEKDFEIKNLTSFKIGGTVSNVYFPETINEFVQIMKSLDKYLILGNCSNVLISSDGYDGNIILTTKMNNYSVNGTAVSADCGVKGPMLSKIAAENSLSGFEFMTGFPGSVGGEVYMNASAHGQSISDILKRCCVFNKLTKEIEYKENCDMEFGYRKSNLQTNGCVLLSAEFELKKGEKDAIQELMSRNLESRKAFQPSLANPNAGSVFKNPKNDSAGRLLDKAGVKALVCNDAAVWEKHANFIVNKGGATSEDVLNLMVQMRNLVKKEFTIELEPEVIYIGNRNQKEVELCKMLYKKIQK